MWPFCCPFYWAGVMGTMFTSRLVEASAQCDGFGNPFFQGMNDAGRFEAYRRHSRHMTRYGECSPAFVQSHQRMIEDFWPQHGTTPAFNQDYSSFSGMDWTAAIDILTAWAIDERIAPEWRDAANRAAETLTRMTRSHTHHGDLLRIGRQ